MLIYKTSKLIVRSKTTELLSSRYSDHKSKEIWKEKVIRNTWWFLFIIPIYSSEKFLEAEKIK